jgi:hypothetical protein
MSKLQKHTGANASNTASSAGRTSVKLYSVKHCMLLIMTYTRASAATLLCALTILTHFILSPQSSVVHATNNCRSYGHYVMIQMPKQHY